MFGVTLALDWDPGERDIDRAQVLTNKLNGGRPEILFQAFQLPRPRNSLRSRVSEPRATQARSAL